MNEAIWWTATADVPQLVDCHCGCGACPPDCDCPGYVGRCKCDYKPGEPWPEEYDE